MRQEEAERRHIAAQEAARMRQREATDRLRLAKEASEREVARLIEIAATMRYGDKWRDHVGEFEVRGELAHHAIPRLAW